MKRTQFVVVGVMVLACLAMAAADVMAAKPPKPTPTPTPTPTPAPPLTITYVEYDTKNATRALMLADEDGATVTELLYVESLEIAEPAWSPDGEWIAFNSRDKATGQMSLNVIRPDGSQLKKIAPRCSFDGGGTTARVQGPSWQPVDPEPDGKYWLVYRDGTIPGGVPGVHCNLDRNPLWIWAVEVDLARPAEYDPNDPPRFAYLASPDPYPWTGYQAVWSWDGRHLAAIQFGPDGPELIVYDVAVDPSTGVPQLANPWSLTPDPENLRGMSFYDVAWANWSDTLIVGARAVLSDPIELWMCAVDFDTEACFGGWTKLTPDGNQYRMQGACFTNDDSEIVVSRRTVGSGLNYSDLAIGPFAAPLDLQLLVLAPRFSQLHYADWRPWP